MTFRDYNPHRWYSPDYNRNGIRDYVWYGMEILLRNNGVCNLTEVNTMSFVTDGKLDKDKMFEAQRLSARMGYRMASIDFELHEWDLVNKEDMLLGCSLTGWQDMVNATELSVKEQESILIELRRVAQKSMEEMADELGTNHSKLVTTMKPSGSISQLPTVSNGVHWSHSPYYIRRVRINAHDPLAKVAKKLGWNWSPEVGQTLDNMDTMVVDFYVKAPKGRTKYEVGAIEQLETYKMFMENYADHNVSITVHVRNDEWDSVEKWVYDNWDTCVAISFLSLDDNFYQLMPYEAITEEEYNDFINKQNKFKPELLLDYETSQNSEVEDSCESGHCPVN